MPASLVLTEDELARVRSQVAAYDWCRAILETYRQRVDELVERRPPIPIEKGRGFYDSCPEDNAVLAFDPYEPLIHRCPKCGKEWTGERYDLAWVRQFQAWLQQRLIEAGILYRLSEDERYAGCVHRALMHFAQHYEEYPLANNLLGPTRLFQSTYLEAFWLLDMVVAYDLTQGSAAYRAKDHEAIKELFYSSVAIIRSFDERESNRQAFNNAGIGAVGLLYDDRELIDHVLHGPHGFAFHMRESLLEDGLWYEGETYHFATLHHLLNLAELARHRGVDLYPDLRPMFDGPLGVMLPDLTFPSRKDSWFGRGVAYHKEIYELGFTRYGDERFGGLLAHAYAQHGGRESIGWRAFLYGRPDLPQIPIERLRPNDCERMPGTGVAVLRREHGAVYASLEYGHYGGGHGHPDRLALSLFAEGVQWLLDPGTGWYHVPELAWYRSSLAHNLVVVDGINQTPAEGQLVAFGTAGDVQIAQAKVEAAYQGVRMKRTIGLADGYLLDVYDLESDEVHTYDWILHTRADVFAGDVREQAVLGSRDGYEFLSEARFLGTASLQATLISGEQVLNVLQEGCAELFRAQAPGVPMQEETPFSTLVARRRAQNARFVTCFARGQRATLEEREPGLYAVTIGTRTDLWRIDEEDGVAVRLSGGDVAWFGRREADLGGIRVTCDRPLEAATLEDLPEDSPDPIPITIQGEPSGVWLEDAAPIFYAGCENMLRFSVSPESRPSVEVPQGWRLHSLNQESPGRWVAHLLAPNETSSGQITLRASEAELKVACKLAAPVTTSWAVVPGPALELTVKDERGAGGNGSVELFAPWTVTTLEENLQLAPGGTRSITVPIPAYAELAEVTERRTQGWPLPGLENTEGLYPCQAVIRFEDFVGIAQARLPLCWSGDIRPIELNQPGQAYWAEHPWAGEQDSSARAWIRCEEGGIRLRCQVRDDLHVTDGSLEDPYENDSVQVYFDFRPSGQRSSNFMPGVAAYVLAPGPDKRTVSIFPIAGNREISNRSARAEWFSTDGVTATATPTPDGYALEAFFPYPALGAPPVQPGDVIGFDLALSDNDGTWYRKTQLVWSGARGRRCYIRGSYHDPQEYGWLIVS